MTAKHDSDESGPVPVHFLAARRARLAPEGTPPPVPMRWSLTGQPTIEDPPTMWKRHLAALGETPRATPTESVNVEELLRRWDRLRRATRVRPDSEC